MDDKHFKEILLAANVLCDFCDCVDCDHCMVSKLVNDAYDELQSLDEDEDE